MVGRGDMEYCVDCVHPCQSCNIAEENDELKHDLALAEKLYVDCKKMYWQICDKYEAVLGIVKANQLLR
jgi:hypothetical protein